MTQTNTGLIRYDAMCKAIAECYRADEAKELRDKARALEVYFKMARNKEAERQAGEIRIRAERRTGQILADMRSSGERRRGSKKPKESDPPTLKKLKITKDQSSQWQELARIPEKDFEATLAAYPSVPNTEGMIMSQRAKQPPPTPIQENASVFFEMLQRFDDETFQTYDALTLTAEFNDETQEEVFRIAAELSLWLKPLTEPKKLRRVK